MGSRLDQIKDWEALAKEAWYCAIKLARIRRVSERQLRRYFQERMHMTPHKWLHELRMRRAFELVRDKTPIKEVAGELGYKDPAHFTHDFKNYYGTPPSKCAFTRTELPPVFKNVRF